MIDEETIEMITERHGRVESGADLLLGALVHWQWLETVGIDPRPLPQLLILDEFLNTNQRLVLYCVNQLEASIYLLDPAESEHCITVVVLEPAPTHHVKDVEDLITLTENITINILH